MAGMVSLPRRLARNGNPAWPRKKPNGGATVKAPARNLSSNGERPALWVETNDKGQIFSHIRQGKRKNDPPPPVNYAIAPAVLILLPLDSGCG
jgi:hypothetical protein